MSSSPQQQQQSPNGSNSRHGNNRASLLVRHKPLVVHGLVNNLVYGIGAVSFVVFAVLELNGRERDAPALVTYTIAFVFFLLNALFEGYIDVSTDKRAVRHGRYSGQAASNLLISSLFCVGTVLDTVAFFLWIERKFVTEHRVLYAASHAWLVTAILVLAGQVPIVDSMDGMELLDDAGNLLFFVGSVVDCIVRYLDTDIRSGSPPRSVAKLEFSSSPMWLASALCYIGADAWRVRRIYLTKRQQQHQQQHQQQQQQQQQTPPPAVASSVPV